MNTRAPILITGMHRSGTSMLAQMLRELGLFLGWRRDEHDEAFFFLEINDWLIRHTGGSWDHPQSIHHLLDNAEIRALTTDYVSCILRTASAIRYLGPVRYLRYRTPFNLSVPWGWKDPRTTFTLPLWLDLFPQARVIHIYRHGVDVANSLVVREEENLARSRHLHERRKKFRLYEVYRKRGNFAQVRCITLEGAFSLWETYLEQNQAHIRCLGPQALEIKYEEFLVDPVPHLRTLIAFCGLRAGEATLKTFAREVEKERAYAHQHNPALKAFAGEMSKRLARWGY